MTATDFHMSLPSILPLWDGAAVPGRGQPAHSFQSLKAAGGTFAEAPLYLTEQQGFVGNLLRILAAC